MSDVLSVKQKFEQQLETRIQTARQRRADAERQLFGGAVDHLPDLSASSEMRGKIAEFESSLDGRLGASRSSTLAPIPLRALADLSDDAKWLSTIDASIENDFDLRRLPQRVGIGLPPRLIPSEKEFRSHVESVLGAMKWNHPVYAVYLPGHGCLLNEEALRAEAKDPNEFRFKALECSVLEKWGWGFFLEYTRLGELLIQSGHWREAAARRLRGDLEMPSAISGVASAVLRSSALTRIGWGLWIRDYLLYKARNPIAANMPVISVPRATKFLDILEVFGRTLENASEVYAIGNAIRYILVQTELAPRGAHLAVRAIHDNLTTVDDLVVKHWHEKFSSQFSLLLFSMLESKVGMFNMPYALLIAGYIDQAQWDKLLKGDWTALESDPRQTVDTRLALLTSIDPRIKYDTLGMSVAAFEEVELDSPKEYFRD